VSISGIKSERQSSITVKSLGFSNNEGYMYLSSSNSDVSVSSLTFILDGVDNNLHGIFQV
jgi:hypothetical protein